MADIPNINKTRISVVTKPTNVSVSTAGVRGLNGYTQDLTLYDFITSSYFIDSASFAERIDAATNEQDLSNYAIISGGNAFIGNQTITGSFLVSGSTIQIGNNTLLGNTLLGGNIGITGTSTLSGSFLVSGSTTQIGNNTLIGLTTLTGSIFIAGDFIPQISSSFTLGTLESPWKDIFIQSGSIIIRSDIPGAASAKISNKTGDITIESAGFRLQSGSFVAFEISETARTVINVPNIPAGDIGAVSIIGNSSGAYQPVINPSGMLHITSNDNQAARVTVDGFGSNIGAIFVGRHARGTAANPTPTLSGDILARFSGLGYSTSSYFPIVGGVPTSLEFQATENYSTSGAGSRAAFYTYKNGHVTRSLSAVIDTDGLIVPNIPTNNTATQVLVWDSVSGRIGKQSGANNLDGGAAASVYLSVTEELNGGGA